MTQLVEDTVRDVVGFLDLGFRRNQLFAHEAGNGRGKQFDGFAALFHDAADARPRSAPEASECREENSSMRRPVCPAPRCSGRDAESPPKGYEAAARRGG